MFFINNKKIRRSKWNNIIGVDFACIEQLLRRQRLREGKENRVSAYFYEQVYFLEIAESNTVE
ncbi:hypothetical protein Cha6605_4793 [Chamaesiphon minutus PCC 6605]|uniref:Uncharacterized protein n=1 Tax=Chamaesiphon minutus (strain ATCC 27169 / PCC 6605) TaxID=1173020 RepID=K9UM22_CHAP6|nr:hypothetical protein Cha6605_4793 [Chamaesiphon minutus PCC 6605]